MRKIMFITVSYDITDNKRRTRLSKTLLDFGERVQYSVFECNLTGKQLLLLENQIEKIVNKHKDTVRIYRFCDACKEKLKIIGTGSFTRDEDVFIF